MIETALSEINAQADSRCTRSYGMGVDIFDADYGFPGKP